MAVRRGQAPLEVSPAGNVATQPPPNTSTFPVHLPHPPPFRQVDFDGLELDDDLTGANGAVPLAFVKQALRNLAPSLLQSAFETVVEDEAASPTAPTSRCTCIPPPAPLPHPTFVLDLHFGDTHERQYIPIHGLAWALASPCLASASRADTAIDEDGRLLLPLLPLSLPSQDTFPFLHDYVYTSSSAQLLQDLLTPPTSAPDDSLKSLSIRLQRLRAFWGNVVGLEIGDEELWTTMRRAWDVLVHEVQEAVEAETRARRREGEVEQQLPS
ncbi:hypothetical protein JCM8097_006435 [Rhodosporidiobolus ruineniae]